MQQIHRLSLSEKDRLFDSLEEEMRERSSQTELQPFSDLEQSHYTNRIERLESEVTALKTQLQEMNDKIDKNRI